MLMLNSFNFAIEHGVFHRDQKTSLIGTFIIPDKLRNYGVDLLKVTWRGRSGSIEKKKLNRG